MSQELKREYLSAIRARYRESSRGKKSLIFDEFCSVCVISADGKMVFFITYASSDCSA